MIKLHVFKAQAVAASGYFSVLKHEVSDNNMSIHDF